MGLVFRSALPKAEDVAKAETLSPHPIEVDPHLEVRGPGPIRVLVHRCLNSPSPLRQTFRVAPRALEINCLDGYGILLYT